MSLAWAFAGMIVLEPSPWKPPQMPLTSSVGRPPAARASRSRARRKHRHRWSRDTPPRRTGARRTRRGRSRSAGGRRRRTPGSRIAPVGALQRGEDRGQGVDRVLDGAAVRARMDVDAGARDVDLAYSIPRRLTRDGRPVALEEPVSLITARSAASRSRFVSSQASRCTDELSSSPSNTYLRLIGRGRGSS